MPDRFACTTPMLGGGNVRDEVVDLISRCLPFVSIVASEAMRPINSAFNA
jgi:hypothetical protein